MSEPTPKALLPICYQTPMRVVYHACVDAELEPYLRQVKWYLSNQNRPASPRFSRELPTESGQRKLTHFLLSRVCFALSLCTPGEERDKLWRDKGALWNFMSTLPRVKFENGNPYDCRLENLSTKTTEEYNARRERELNPRIVPPPSTFIAPVMDADEYGDRPMKPLELPAAQPTEESVLRWLDTLGGAPEGTKPLSEEIKEQRGLSYAERIAQGHSVPIPVPADELDSQQSDLVIDLSAPTSDGEATEEVE
jgi:hypothetical protein